MAGDITVFGSGSYGTALAIQLARNGQQVRLWGRDRANLEAMAAAGENARYLPGCAFPANLEVVSDFEVAVASPRWLVAVPSHGLDQLVTQLQPHWRPGVAIVSAVKGFAPNSGEMPHEVVARHLPDAGFVAVSGPTFAKEIGRGIPSALTIASRDAELATSVAEQLHGPLMRAYTSDDVIGVEVGGSVKNVIAIAVGVADGMGLGANTRTMLITRGLSEVMRLAEALGGRRETLMGLAGMGDLVLTCTDDQSRNRRFGKAIGQGESRAEAEAAIGQVVEGARNAVEVHTLARRKAVDMPIATEVFRVLWEDSDVRDAIARLISRPQRSE